MKCGLHFKSRIYTTGLGNDRQVPRCPNCYRLGSTSIGEKELLHWIERQGIRCLSNIRSIIPPLELDIYIPDYKLAIEYNGIHWHKSHDKNYHLNKMEQCRGKGIRLLQFFDFEWDAKRALVIQTVSFYLNLIEKEHIKNLVVKNCIADEALKFYDKYSFSNNAGDYNLAFLSLNEAVAMISFNMKGVSCEIVNFGFASVFVRKKYLCYIVDKVFELSDAKTMTFSLDMRLYSVGEFAGFDVVDANEPKKIQFKNDFSYDCGNIVIAKKADSLSIFENVIDSLPFYRAHSQLMLF